MIKQLIDEISKSSLVIIAFIAALLIFNNLTIYKNGSAVTGLYNIMGAASYVDDKDYNKVATQTFNQVVGAAKPEVRWIGTTDLKSQEDIDIFEHMQIKFSSWHDYKAIDNNMIVQIQDVTDEKSQSIMNHYDEATHVINFPDCGIYKITIYIRDTEQKETIAEIKVPVN